MKVAVKLAQPKNAKERLFRLETEVDDLKNPASAYFHIGGKEYVIEISYD